MKLICEVWNDSSREADGSTVIFGSSGLHKVCAAAEEVVLRNQRSLLANYFGLHCVTPWAGHSPPQRPAPLPKKWFWRNHLLARLHRVTPWAGHIPPQRLRRCRRSGFWKPSSARLHCVTPGTFRRSVRAAAEEVVSSIWRARYWRARASARLRRFSFTSMVWCLVSVAPGPFAHVFEDALPSSPG